MRQVVLDTETTGLRWEDGHRVIEIGCVELVDRRPSGQTLHFYIHPERTIDAGAQEVHGISLEDLADKPKFAEVADRIVEFLDGAELLAHNANFDVGFLNAEFRRIESFGRRFDKVPAQITDTIAMARSLHPGKRNSLDALCDRYGISNAHRTRHGALLDAELLAEVYLAMTRGQESLMIDLGASTAAQQSRNVDWPPKELLLVEPSTEEWQAHDVVLIDIDKASKGTTVWRKLGANSNSEDSEVVG